jgi:hypothetical protein
MKKIALIFAALLAMTGVAPAQAEQQATVVVIDSGFSTNHLPDGTLELCVIYVNVGCNNGTGFEFGSGSSDTQNKVSPRFRKDWNHGTIMANIVHQINSDVRLIVIRNARVLKNGSVIAGNEKDLELSLAWAIENAERYNISAISFSRGQHTWTRAKSPQCPINENIRSKIIQLQELGVATVIAAGNNRNKSRIDYPACISESVAISTRSKFDNRDGSANPTLNTNIGADTDFVVYGTFSTPLGRVAESSSAATAAFAGYWSKVSNGSFTETYNSLLFSGKTTKGFSAVSLDVIN